MPDRADPAAAVRWAVDLGRVLPHPGSGSTRRRWETLATVAAADLAVARVLEPHVDALAILAEAGIEAPEGSSWGVYAAEGPGARLEATASDEGWRVQGRKPWCSMAGHVSHALVTAWTSDTERALVAVDLRRRGVSVEDGTWTPVGLAEVSTTPIRADDVPVEPVGGPGWYVERDGFGWGGMGVAAVWYGGAVGLARRLRAQTGRREPDQVALMHLGAVDASLAAARAVLASAAAEVDTGHAGGADGVLLGARVRQVVADACEDVLSRVGHALGPGPLSQEADHAHRVGDLTLYLRQHHAERDAAALGRLVADADADDLGSW